MMTREFDPIAECPIHTDEFGEGWLHLHIYQCHWKCQNAPPPQKKKKEEKKESMMVFQQTPASKNIHFCSEISTLCTCKVQT